MNKKGKIRLWSFITNGNKRSSECRMCSQNFPEYFLSASIMVKETTEKFQFYFKIYHWRKKDRLRVELPEETADISWFTTGFPAKWRHSVEISTLFTCHYPELGSAYDGLSQTKFASGNAKHYPVLRSDASTVWNFYSRSSDVISQGNHWCGKSTVFSGYLLN